MIKLLVRRLEQLVCLWELDAEKASTLDGPDPVDLNLEMTQALHRLGRPGCNDLAIDALFLADRATRFWMDVQGMRHRWEMVTAADPTGTPHDYFKGVRVAVREDT